MFTINNLAQMFFTFQLVIVLQGLIFKVIPSTFDEEAVAKDLFENPDDYVKLVAHGKAQAVAETLANDDKNCLVIGADTVIVGKQIKIVTSIKALKPISIVGFRIGAFQV